MQPQSAPPPSSPARPAAMTLILICDACETMHHSPTADLPAGWTVIDLGGEPATLCPDCDPAKDPVPAGTVQ